MLIFVIFHSKVFRKLLRARMMKKNGGLKQESDFALTLDIILFRTKVTTIGRSFGSPEWAGLADLDSFPDWATWEHHGISMKKSYVGLSIVMGVPQNG